MVMRMKQYENFPRLRASDKTWQRHILVKQSVYSSYRQHWHDYFELEVVLQGSGTHYQNDEMYQITQGDAYLLTPVDYHKIESAASIELINISFDVTWLSDELGALLYSPECVKRYHFSDEELQQFIKATELLKYEYEHDGPCIRQILEYLISRFVSGKRANASRPQMDGIMRAVAYMEQHFREHITLEQLSEEAGYHPAYFSNLFRKVTGETYTERLTALRIRYAETLLKSGFSVAEVCYASGFGSLSHFSYIFKKHCGESPAAYREKCKK